MKAVVVYESMYGNTHLIADAIAEGLRANGVTVEIVPAAAADAERLSSVDLTVVGGPTHVHGMARQAARKAALDAASKPGSDLAVDPDAEGTGLRDWFESVHHLSKNAAAFDTRINAPAAFTGRASKGIAKQLRAHGCTVIVEPESFLVTKENQLVDDETTHARNWGTRLAQAIGVRE